MKKKYNEFIEENVNLEKLIRMLDKDKDGILSMHEMRTLLSVSLHTPPGVNEDRAAAILAQNASDQIPPIPAMHLREVSVRVSRTLNNTRRPAAAFGPTLRRIREKFRRLGC